MTAEERKTAILEYITTTIEKKGFSPTYGEIASALGFRSKSSVARYVEQLKAEGKLSKDGDYAYRALRVCCALEIPENSIEQARRVQLVVAGGGSVTLDCTVKKDENDGIVVDFSGVLDATRLKKQLGYVVDCVPEEADEG